MLWNHTKLTNKKTNIISWKQISEQGYAFCQQLCIGLCILTKSSAFILHSSESEKTEVTNNFMRRYRWSNGPWQTRLTSDKYQAELAQFVSFDPINYGGKVGLPKASFSTRYCFIFHGVHLQCIKYISSYLKENYILRVIIFYEVTVLYFVSKRSSTPSIPMHRFHVWPAENWGAFVISFTLYWCSVRY